MSTTAERTDGSSAEADYGNPRLSVRNPQRWLKVAIWIAVPAAVAALAGVGALLAHDRAVGGSLLGLGVGGLVGAALLLPTYFYSRRDPERARRTAQHQQAIQDRRLRRHPVAYLIGLPVAVGVLTPLRVALRHSASHEKAYSPMTLVSIGLVAAAGMAVIVGILVRRAERRGAQESSKADVTGPS